MKGQVNGSGRKESDGTYTAVVEITKLKNLEECETMARVATIAIAELIGMAGGNPQKIFDSKEGGAVT